jgi:hypothetical protein
MCKNWRGLVCEVTSDLVTSTLLVLVGSGRYLLHSTVCND